MSEKSEPNGALKVLRDQGVSVGAIVMVIISWANLHNATQNNSAQVKEIKTEFREDIDNLEDQVRLTRETILQRLATLEAQRNK